MRRSIFALVGVVGALVVPPAAAQDQVTWHEAEACLSDPDVAICWLRLSARADGGRSLRRDPELQTRPHVLALAGVNAEPEPAPEASTIIPDQPGLTRTLDAFAEALERSRDAIGLRQDPDRVVGLLSTVPLTGDVAAANPPQSQVLSAGRLDAYAIVAAALEQNRESSPAYFTRVLSAVLAAWERDLATVDKAEIFNNGPDVLAGFHARRGANDAARRVLMNGYADDEPTLISALINLDLLDDAFAVADAANPSRGVDRLRREEAAAMALMERQMAPYRQAMLDQLLSELPEDERGAFLLEMEAEMAAQDPSGEWGPPSAEELLLAVEGELADARTDLLHASVVAGRTDLAVPTARRIVALALEKPDVGGDSSLGRALTVIVEAEGAAATGLIEQMADHARVQRSGLFQLLPSIHEAWIKLERPDRADALIEEWRPRAVAESEALETGDALADFLTEERQTGARAGLQSILIATGDIAGAEALGWLSPETAIREDFRRGRGASLLEERLAGRNTNDQLQILTTCRHLALAADDLPGATTCAQRYAGVAETPESLEWAAQGLLEVAARAAELDQIDLAERLIRNAVSSGAAAEVEGSNLSPFFSPLPRSLPAIAKAMLRQDGRLPPRAAGD